MERKNKLLVIGLGNPDKEYETTYHNAGFLAADHFAKRFSPEPPLWRIYRQGKFTYCETSVALIVKPLTFMNESGGVVVNSLRYFDIDLNSLILIHDDSDLPLGSFKMERGRGSAGHHGVESVINALGTNDFTRVRIGIRADHKRKAGEFVLSRLNESDLVLLYSSCDRAVEKLMEKK